MTALIVCNGSIEDYSAYGRFIEKADFIIGVDGGARHLKQLGLKPDILLGDFDSIDNKDLEGYRISGTEIMKFPVEKDMTDAELAIETAIGRGHKTIIMLGVLGSRMDHSLANIFLLKRILDKGSKGIIANEKNEITLINDKMEIRREEGLKITLLPLSTKVTGVNLKGFYYPLVNATLETGSTWGVSNEITGDTGEIKIKDGLLLVIKARD